MLSYKHAFHSGNHADVLKHVLLLETVHQFKQKNKPFCVFDTHAGAGVYSYDDAEVLKNREFETGVALLKNDQSLADGIIRYQTLIEQFGRNKQLPGSPVLIAESLREEDELTLFELHASEADKLKRLAELSNANIHHRDGFEGIVGLTPPKIRRGMVIIDPPYELLDEYQKVVSTVSQVLHKWPNACILVWYPLLTKRAKAKSGQSEKMLQKLAPLAKSGVFKAELSIASKNAEVGMYGSGMLGINPPWQLYTAVSDIIEQLHHMLNATDTNLEWLVPPT
ncbi:23S rRNA (adenine(2030)-N(6))-methyltransferase RlmJ [Alteromonas flava]|uniref:23S rRNA (adenine(2030)-N(6))-methyltransferase RlmJ n=1 Tax=Alteromonas flava TaxID=2048003 RepID=UPI0013DD3476|nr:23S rRNA (adenine(2030)-N(6))-methyltransferase RlmJ [Alteromonas flava]